MPAVPERPQHRRGHSLSVLLFHSAHLHAQMTSLDNDPNSLRTDVRLDRLRNLIRHPLLNLQAPRKHIHQPRDFAQPEHALARQVLNMRSAEEWQQMMLTQAEE